MSVEPEGFPANPDYKLVFEEERWRGLTVVTVGASIAELFALDRADAAVTEAKNLDDCEAAARVRNALFANKISSWNLVDREKQPLPISVDALCDQVDSTLVTRMFRAWRRALSGVPGPLDNASGTGASSNADPEVEATLAALPSESLAS